MATGGSQTTTGGAADQQQQRYLRNLLRRQQGGIGGAAMAASAKKLLIYRNGDSSFRPLPYTYNSRTSRTFAALLDQLETKVPPVNGGNIRKFFSLDGRVQITSLEELISFDGDQLVAAGNEPYRPIANGYESINADPKRPLRRQASNAKRAPDSSSRIRLTAYSTRRAAGGDNQTATANSAVALATSDERTNERTHEPQHQEDEPEDDDQGRLSATFRMSSSRRGRQLREVDSSQNSKALALSQRLTSHQPAKKINLYRAADPAFRPKTFVYRPRVLRTWQQFLEEMSTLVPPKEGGPALHLYTMDGEEVSDYGGIQSAESYMVAGEKGYRSAVSQDRQKAPTLTSQKSFGEGHPAINGNRSPSPRPRSQQLHNRQDQTNPDQLFLFVFLNGDGLKATRCLFAPVQLGRGMEWLKEQIAKKFGVYPKKLCKMDGRTVLEVGELESKGAYVLVPKGELFRDTWYYLPDGSFDTSKKSETERERLGSRQTVRSLTAGETARDVDTVNAGSNRRQSHHHKTDRAKSTRSARRQSEFSAVASSEGDSEYSYEYNSDDSEHSHYSGHSRVQTADSHCTVCDALQSNLRHHHKQNHSPRRSSGRHGGGGAQSSASRHGRRSRHRDDVSDDEDGGRRSYGGRKSGGGRARSAQPRKTRRDTPKRSPSELNVNSQARRSHQSRRY